MILYLDASSLVKLYVTEAHSGLARSWALEAEILATCRVAYPEMISVLNRRFRTGDLSRGEYDLLIKAFTSDWRHFAVIDFDEIVAGRLASIYGLRGFDAVHLSAAKRLSSAAGTPSMAFSSFDDNLNAAARAEKLTVLLPKE